MEMVKVIFNHDDEDYLITRINGSREEIAKYYMGNVFNVGSETYKMKTCTKVEFID